MEINLQTYFKEITIIYFRFGFFKHSESRDLILNVSLGFQWLAQPPGGSKGRMAVRKIDESGLTPSLNPARM